MAQLQGFVVASAAMALTATLSGAGQDAASLSRSEPPTNGIWLDSLNLENAPLRRPRVPRGQTGTPPPLVFSLAGTTYAHAVPLLSDGDVGFELAGNATRFVSVVGIDDTVKAPAGSVIFGVWVDGKNVFDSGIMHGGDTPKLVSVDLTDAKQLVLAMNDANDGTGSDIAEWGGAAIVMKPGAQAPQVLTRPTEPPPHIASSRSRPTTLNYPRIVGATPGRPFLFRIPASGDPPLTFKAIGNVPEGLALDERTGIISGSLRRAGRWQMIVNVSNRVAGPIALNSGSQPRPPGPQSGANFIIDIIGGEHKLALTPPLGWNSWNVWGAKVDDAKVRAAADAMVSSGLAAQGYTYINIDDSWEGPRTADGEITSNEKFPNMKALADYVHAKGLKIGLYSSPGPRTCEQKFAGSYQHEEQDARTWAKWGFDYIKYDWCSYSDVEPLAARAPLDALQKPYVLMRGVLDKLDRDFVYSLCQYGWGKVWEWGGQVGGNLWRVTGDITDTWISMSSIGFQQTGHEQYAGPGHWNDTDMLVVGKLGWGREEPRPTRLTPNEQLTHISLWALQAAPLLIGADLSQIDDFTRDLLGNRDVIEIDQDPLGKAAHRIASDGWTEVWTRPMSTGGVAVGLFNRGPEPASVSVALRDIGVTSTAWVCFPWTHECHAREPMPNNTYTATVPRHGVVLVTFSAH